MGQKGQQTGRYHGVQSNKMRGQTSLIPDLDWFNHPRNPSHPDPEEFDQSPGWQPAEIRLDDARILVLEDF